MIRPFRSRPVVTPDRLVALLVALVPLVYFFPAVKGSIVLAPDDGVLFNVPLRAAAAHLLRQGFIPLWNPYIFSGMPLHAAVQGGLLFPLNWWFLIINPATAANLMVLSTYSLAGVGAYLYARRSGNTIPGALVTCLSWQLGGVLIGQISHINIVQTEAMMPLVLWSIDGYAEDGSRRRAMLVAVLVAFQVFVGHPQTLTYSLLVVAAYAITMCVFRRQLRARYLHALPLIAIGLLLAAVQILPTFELLRNSIRSDASYGFFTSFSMPFQTIKTFVAPYLLGGGDGRLFRVPYIGVPYYGEMIAYVSIAAIMLALVALALKPDLLTKFWASVAVIGFVLALGDFAPFHLYRLIYHLPVLSLFRVPARHLMEVEFALAVLAGRGLTTLSQSVPHGKERVKVFVAGAFMVLLTCLLVTVGRPATFKLAREAPVTLLRAPELFLPIVMAVLSAVALWYAARRRTGFILVVLVVDLVMWGQFSGWAFSPTRAEEIWATPASVQALREVVSGRNSDYRILTVPHKFDPSISPVPPSVSHATEWSLWTQPDIYMMHGIQNAAGYDGFGLERYSHLAGEMKVWGELTSPDATLRGESREIDVLNVRYLISMRQQATVNTQSSPASDDFPLAAETFGTAKFAARELGLPNIKSGDKLGFRVPPVTVDKLALVTNLSWSEQLPNGTSVARIRLHSSDGHDFEFALRTGVDTSEWAYDRPDIHARIRHQRATVASSYKVEDTLGSYEGHSYVTSFSLPQKTTIVSGEIIPEDVRQAPDLLLQVFRLSLADSSAAKFYPVNREWVRREKVESAPVATAIDSSSRWHLTTQTKDVEIYENRNALPRAWLANSTLVLDDQQTLSTIRTGRTPNGTRWDPLTTVLVESQVPLPPASSEAGTVDVMTYEPNRIELKAQSTAAAILVLSENHYPGWRAYVDGNNVDVLRVDYNLRGVLLSPGSHQVTFLYRPKSVLIGLLVSLMTLALLIVWCARKSISR